MDVMDWTNLCKRITAQLKSDQQFVDRFKTLKTNEDKVSLCLSDESVRQLLDQYLTIAGSAKHRKYWEKAKEFRIEGNDCFKKKDFDGAVEAYTQAILMAVFPDDGHIPEDKTELPTSFANRSAVWYHLKQYDNCLSDISNAFKYGYDLKVDKLLLRKANCLVQKLLYADAKAVIDSIDRKLLTEDKQLESQVNSLRKLIDEKGAKNPSNCVNRTKHKQTLKFVSNKTMPNASQSLELCTSQEKGRHVVAKDDIQMADIVFMERPFSSVLLPEFYKSYCHHCYRKLSNIAVMSCRQCTQVRYCSDQCSADSWAQYHRHECGLLNVMHDIGIAHLAFRTLLMSGVDNAVRVATAPLQTRPNPHTNDYLSVYSLLDHSDDFTFDDSLCYSLVSSLLLLLTEKIGLVANETENFKTIGGVLLKHILQLITNGHAISDQQNTESSLGIMFEDKRIATALYPTVSLMNHSCDPNVCAVYDKNLLIVRAAKPIAKGQEVMNCYGPHCKRMSKKERQSVLRDQYFFRCECNSCVSIGEDSSRALRCDRCSGPIIPQEEAGDSDHFCLDCKKDDFDTKEMLKKVETGLKLLDIGTELNRQMKITESEPKLLESLQKLESVLYSKNKTLGQVLDELCFCCAEKGQWAEAVGFCRRSVEIVSDVFGESSVEVMNELLKLSDLQFELLNTEMSTEDSINAANNCLVTTSRAIKLLTNYSVPTDDENSPQVLEMKKMNERLLYCDAFAKQFYKK